MIDLKELLKQAEINSKIFEEDAKDSAGREAERIVARDLRPRLAGTGWELVQNIRVPDPAMRRQRELDFIITAPDRVVVIELKRWSGKVHMSGDEVIQERRNGELKNHGPLFEDLADRVQLLRHRHLAAKRDSVRMEGLVVFYDDRGRLILSDDIAARPDVVDYARMMDNIPQGSPILDPPSKTEASFLAKVLGGILAMLGQTSEPPAADAPRPPAPSWAIMDFRRTLAELGTWDVIELYGGKMVYGDLLDVTGTQHPAFQATLFNRAATARVEIKSARNPLQILFAGLDGQVRATAVARNGFSGDWRVPPDLPIVVQAAGQATSEAYPAGSVLSIEFGYEKKPMTRLLFGELAVGMLLSGKVKFFGKRGAFVNVGIETAQGKRRDALARPAGPGRDSLTVEQAEAWRGVKPGARVLVRVKSLDLGGKLAEIDIVDVGQAF